MTLTESKYGILTKEMLTIVWALDKFEYKFRGRKFILETEHKALAKMKEKPNFENASICRSIEKIQGNEFQI